MKKRLMSALAAAVLTVTALAVPTAAHAKPEAFDRYSGSESVDVDHCGFTMHVDVTYEGLFMMKSNKDGPALWMDNYYALETVTANGRTLTIEHQGMLKDTSIEHIQGTIYQVEAMEAGQPTVARDEDGNVLLRDRGLLRFTFQWDTTDPERIDIGSSFELLSEHGSHPAFFTDFCVFAEEYFFG
jgi:hypothetical protein